MKKYIAVAAAAASLIAVAVAVSKGFCDFAFKRGKGTFKIGDISSDSSADKAHAELKEQREKRTAEFKKWLNENAEDVYLLTNDGIKVHALMVKAEERSRKYAVVCHGYKDSADGMGFAAYSFVQMGYNVIAPDGRVSGKTEGKYIGMGWLERRDLKGYVNFILAKDPQAEIVLYGVSMGAAEVMMAAGNGLPVNVKAVVEDSGFTSVWDEFSLQMKSTMNIPVFPLLPMASLYAKIFLGFSFKEASAKESLKQSKIPILMIGGTDDNLVPLRMLEELYDAAAGEKEKLVIEGAGHMECDLLDSNFYWKSVESFLNKYIR
ncbi:MAG: alpha/beta hydrolase [Oscillospiraceae bacterium]|nr:alpha/beta hydrolase [Oscillospiraceae bacterium]